MMGRSQSRSADEAESRSPSPTTSRHRSNSGDSEADSKKSQKTNGAYDSTNEDERPLRMRRSSSREPRARRRSRSTSKEKKTDEQHSDEEKKDKARSRSRSPVDRSSRRSRSRSRSRSPRDRNNRRRRSRSYSPSSRRRNQEFDRHSDEDGYRLHVADLDVNASKRDMEKVFGKFGPLKEIWMARSVPCFAFVVFRYKEDAEEACRKTDGVEVCSRRIRVTIARPRTRGLGRRGFDPSMRCYQCGDRGHFSRDCPDSKYGYKRPPSPRGGGGRYYPKNDRFEDDRRERRY